MAFRRLSLGRLTGRRPGRWLDWAAPLGFGLALMVLTPWRTGFGFAGNEGYELMKALLVSRGHPLYGPFWNDQPPLHTELLAGLFRIFGPSADVGRLLTMAFAMLLVGALYGLARRGSNRLAGVAAVGLLASASGFLQLSVSVMLEVPAFALGVASVWAWVRWQKDGRRRWLVVSGVLFGSALQVKFTAALLLPALGVDFALWAWRHRQSGIKTPSGRSGVSGEAGGWWEPAVVWLGSAAVVFVGVMLLWYQPGTWKVFWASHFSANTRASAEVAKAIFRPTVLDEDLTLLVPAAAGLGVLLLQRRRELLFPAALLATVLAVHWHHRPFWPYYRLHFWIPLAWLGGAGLVEGFRELWRRFPPQTWPSRLGFAGGWLVWSLAASTALTLAPEKTWFELRQLRLYPLAKDQVHVAALRSQAAGVRWVFTIDKMTAFWAGLPIPPELAVIPTKRHWSGQIRPAEVKEVLERYRPELIYLSEPQVRQFELVDYLKSHYEPATDLGVWFWRRRPDQGGDL